MRLEVTRKSDLAVGALRVLVDTDGRVKGPALAKTVAARDLTRTQREKWAASTAAMLADYLDIPD